MDVFPLVKGPHVVVTWDAGQHSLLLQQSVFLTYAVPGTSIEGDEGVGVSLCYSLWQEVVRIKLLRVGEVISVPTDVIDEY
jgi:hypothetical protein